MLTHPHGSSFAALAGWSGRSARRAATVAALTGLLPAVPLGACMAPDAAEPPVASAPPAAAPSLAVYALSRGGGVPRPTLRAFAAMEQHLAALQADGGALALGQQRIGLEGERKLCAVFADPRQASAAQAALGRLGAGVELLDVASEPCAP